MATATTEDPLTRPAPTAPATVETPFSAAMPRLGDRWQSWYAKQAAHAQMSVANCRWNRSLLILVVILSTIMGSSFIASVGENPPTGLKIGLGVLGLFAAVLAALKEKVPFADYSEQHADAEAGFEDLRYGVEELADRLAHGDIDYDHAVVRLHALENKAERLDRDAPRVSGWRMRRAVRSIKKTRKDRNELYKVLGDARKAQRAVF